MSPEQCRGDPVDGRSDLFSAGGVLHELLTGQRPFPGSSFTEVAHRLLHEPTPRIPAGAPSSVQAVLDRAMAKRAEDRYPTAASMAAALRAASSDTDATLVDATLVDTTLIDATLVDAPPAEFAPHSALDHARLDDIERKLARHVGPIARYLVQTASSAATSIEELCGTLGSIIKQDASRQAFLDDVLGPVRSRGGSAAPAAVTSSRPAPPPPALALPPDAVEQLQRELSRYIGPIAKVLVRRALAAAQTEQELRRQLAEHIDQPGDRAAFLRQS
jgi:serine/threonine-protein kinase